MIFTVEWQTAARDELAEAWLAGTSATRRQITVAARDIEAALTRDPGNTGESRTAEERIFFTAPLGVLFEIDEEARLVRILKAWSYKA